MKTYSKIHLISDIHGYYQGLNDGSKLCSEENPLFVLGDLFDHKYGDENKIIDLLLELNGAKSLFLIKGNHDLIVEVAFNQVVSNELARSIITKQSNLKKFKIFQTIFDDNFYHQFLQLRAQLNDSQQSSDNRLETYYSAIDKLASQEQYNSRYKKLKKLLSLFSNYQTVEVNGVRLLLSHSGKIDDLSARDTAKASYQLDERFDYGVIGHLTIPMVEQMIIEEGNMLDFDSNFELNPHFDKISVIGNFMYNKHSKIIMIDNGSANQQVITIKEELIYE